MLWPCDWESFSHDITPLSIVSNWCLTLRRDAIVLPSDVFFACGRTRKVNKVIFRLWFTAELFFFGEDVSALAFATISQRGAGRSSGDNLQSGWGRQRDGKTMSSQHRLSQCPTSPSPPDALSRSSHSRALVIPQWLHKTLRGYKQQCRDCRCDFKEKFWTKTVDGFRCGWMLRWWNGDSVMGDKLSD